jgi:hypothetical protein
LPRKQIIVAKSKEVKMDGLIPGNGPIWHNLLRKSKLLGVWASPDGGGDDILTPFDTDR